MRIDATQLFSKRVENYRKYRPDYPAAAIELLRRECGLTAASAIADIGSGTGLFARALLEAGFTVTAVEPNREMREAAEEWLSRFPAFRSVDGRAEATTLPDSSVDLITAAQAFHWFDAERTRAEWLRILRPQGQAALMWNEWDEGSALIRAVDEALERYDNHKQDNGIREVTDARVRAFFAPAECRFREFPHEQVLDFAGLLGRVLSCSWVPAEGDPESEALAGRLRGIFDVHRQNGAVRFEYRTRIWWGPLSAF